MHFDGIPLTATCPLCEFQNTFTVKQVRLRDIIICRGCKANIQLADHMNECKKMNYQTERAIDEFQKSLKKLNFIL